MTPQQPMPLPSIGFSTRTGGNKKRWDQGISWLEFTDGKWMNLRFFGHNDSILVRVATHWLATKTGKRFPMMCPNFNNVTAEFSNTGCPICDEFDPRNSEIKEIKDIAPRISGLTHAIDRDVQEMGGNGPDWKPWRPVRVPISVMISLEKYRGRNIHTINGKKYEADVADPYYGCDVAIQYDSASANPQAKYTTERGNHAPLTEEEQGYIAGLYDYRALIEYPDEKEIKKALLQNGYYKLLNGEDPAPTIVGGTVPVVDLSSKAPTPPTMQDAPLPVSGGMGGPKALSDDLGAIPEEDIPFAPSNAEPAAKKKVAPEQVAVVEAPEVTTPEPAVTASEVVEEVSEAAEAAEGGRTFKTKDSPHGVSLSVFQESLVTYAENLKKTSPKRAFPMRVCESGQLEGIEVMKCYGEYRGDMNCVRCPARGYCLKS